MTMRQVARNIPSVFVNYFSISREAFMKNKKAQSKIDYDIYVLALKWTWQLLFCCFCPTPLKGEEIII